MSLLLVLTGAVSACGGQRSAPDHPAATGGAPGAGGVGGSDGAVAQPMPDASPPEAGPPAVLIDPGWIGVRRLTDAEYENTMRDLLGVESNARQQIKGLGLDIDQHSQGFDNLAEGQKLGDRYEWYFGAAIAMTDEAFADPIKRARIITCTPASATDDECTRKIIRAFGLRAWRRPLTDGEVDDLTRLVREAQTGGAEFATALQQAVVALLAAESFFYKIEIDPDPNAPTAHPLTGFELATRLSYLLWSTLPDETLFALASNGQLLEKDVLRAQVTRMLADARSDEFVRHFAGQWLGFRTLEKAQFLWWFESLVAASRDEAVRFVATMIRQNRSLPDLLTADLNFVNDASAMLYGFPSPSSTTALVQVSVTTDARKGYLGLVAPLVQTSTAAKTSPAARGRWILSNLLCTDIVSDHEPMTAVVTSPRDAAAARAANPACAKCHGSIDAVGLGLENFDQVGRFRESYDPPGGAIDPTGRLPNGKSFRGLNQLADLLASDPQFWRCAGRKAITYALARTLAPSDDSTLNRIAAEVESGGLTIRGLLTAIVTDDVFRTRRGEDKP